MKSYENERVIKNQKCVDVYCHEKVCPKNPKQDHPYAQNILTDPISAPVSFSNLWNQDLESAMNAGADYTN